MVIDICHYSSLYRDNLSINSSAFFIGLNWYTKSDDFRSERQSSYLLPNEFYRLIFDLERAYNGQSKFKYDPETKKLLEPKGTYFVSIYKAFTLKCRLKTQSIENNLYPWGIELFSEYDGAFGLFCTSYSENNSIPQGYKLFSIL